MRSARPEPRSTFGRRLFVLAHCACTSRSLRVIRGALPAAPTAPGHSGQSGSLCTLSALPDRNEPNACVVRDTRCAFPAVAPWANSDRPLRRCCALSLTTEREGPSLPAKKYPPRANAAVRAVRHAGMESNFARPGARPLAVGLCSRESVGRRAVSPLQTSAGRPSISGSGAPPRPGPPLRREGGCCPGSAGGTAQGKHKQGPAGSRSRGRVRGKYLRPFLGRHGRAPARAARIAPAGDRAAAPSLLRITETRF